MAPEFCEGRSWKFACLGWRGKAEKKEKKKATGRFSGHHKSPTLLRKESGFEATHLASWYLYK
jgi:hypothetical protein